VIGRVISGKYRIDALLGEGAMGIVYRARQEALGRDVAVKVMHPHLARNKTFATRFEREAQAASKLVHPNSILVTDFGAEPEDGILYLVMELVSGQSLERLIADNGAMPELRVARIISQALSALGLAHDMGIVHRDLKPENILMVQTRDDDGNAMESVKVCDFGIARMFGVQDLHSSADTSVVGANMDASAAFGDTLPPSSLNPLATTAQDVTGKAATKRLTAVGAIVGTPSYLSPEQARSAPVDARSDLYSLGVVMYEMLTGSLPYDATTVEDMLYAHLHVTPVRPSARANVSSEIADVCMKALAKDPENRWPSARAMRNALKELGGIPTQVMSAVMPVAGNAQGALREAPKTPKPSETTTADRQLGTGKRLRGTQLDASSDVRKSKAAGPKSPLLPMFLGAGAIAIIGFAGTTWFLNQKNNTTNPNPVAANGGPTAAVAAAMATNVETTRNKPADQGAPAKEATQDPPGKDSIAKDPSAKAAAGARPDNDKRVAGKLGAPETVKDDPVNTPSIATTATPAVATAPPAAATVTPTAVQPPPSTVAPEPAAAKPAVTIDKARVAVAVTRFVGNNKNQLAGSVSRVDVTSCYRDALRKLGSREVGSGSVQLNVADDGLVTGARATLPPGLVGAKACIEQKFMALHSVAVPDTGATTADIALTFDVP
jgi:eukaryotic-like serine/threonine-protein kinase